MHSYFIIVTCPSKKSLKSVGRNREKGSDSISAAPAMLGTPADLKQTHTPGRFCDPSIPSDLPACKLIAWQTA